MTYKAQKIQDVSSDDDAPEVVFHSTSKSDAKRNQKALRDFEAEEKARKKVRNRERDENLKERARITRGGKAREKPKGVRFLEGQGEGDSDEGEGGSDVEARMLRAMRDAAGEVESEEEEVGDNDEGEDDEFKESMLGDGSVVSGSDDEDAQMSSGNDSIDPEAPTDDGEMDEDEEDDKTTLRSNTIKSDRKADYLADDLFAAAFASQNSKLVPKKKTESAQRLIKKRRRKSITHPKDLVVGFSGRTIRTLPRLSDPQSQATARSVPSARVRRFVDNNLALKGKKALLNAKKKGWERRSANVGVMKYQGAPHGFVRSTR